MSAVGAPPTVIGVRPRWRVSAEQGIVLARLLAILVLAAAPPLLVVADRWTRAEGRPVFMSDTWCRGWWLCQLALPSYFGLVFVSYLGLLVLFRLARRETTRGWALYEEPLGHGRMAWRERAVVLASVLLFHGALVALVASWFAPSRPVWLPLLIFGLAAANLLLRRAGGPALWLVSAAIVLLSVNLDAWWLAVVGDEYAFFRYADELATRRDLAFIGSKLFDGQAVYGTHPFLSSLIQAISLKLFGSANFGWRFSSLYLAALSVGLCFSFFRTFTAHRVALVACALLACSHYLMSFGKIGYNNLQALFAFSLALALAAFAIRTQWLVAFALLGLGVGFCFYVYPAALYAVPIPFLLLLFYFPPRSAAAIRRWMLAVVSMGLLISPLLLQPGYWAAKMPGTLLIGSEVTRGGGQVAFHFASNLVYGLFSFLYIPHETHFIAVSYVDPLTAGLIPLGLLVLIRQLRRERFARFALAAYAVLLLLVGATHDRSYPPNTRMFLLLPWFTLFAAVGLSWILQQLGRLGLSGRRSWAIVGLVVVGAVGLNLYQANVVSKARSAGSSQNVETLFLRLAREALDPAVQPPKRFVFLNDPRRLHVDSLRELLRIYSVPFDAAQMVEVVLTDETIPRASLASVADSGSLVFVSPRLERGWQASLARDLRQMGKEPCPIRNSIGERRFTVWHAQAAIRQCDRAE